jgi:hypothetical protein
MVRIVNPVAPGTLHPTNDGAVFLRQVKTIAHRPGIGPVLTDRSRRKFMTTEPGPQRIPPYEIGDGLEESDKALTGILNRPGFVGDSIS